MKQETSFYLKKSWRLFLADMGIPPNHVLKLAKLSDDLFCQDKPKLKTDEFFRFWSALEHTIGEHRLLKELVNNLNTNSFDPAVFAFLCSPCLAVALNRLAEYEQLISPITMRVTVENTRTIVNLNFNGTQNVPPAFMLFKLLYIRKFAEIGTRESITPISITIPKQIKNLDSLSSHFGINIGTSDFLQIVFANADTQKPFLTEDSSMWSFFADNYDIRKASLTERVSIKKRLSNVLVEMLPSGDSSIEEASKRLAMSSRSLQRKLKQEQSSFKSVLCAIRWKLANTYLLEPELTINEIAYLLAYHDPSSFQKAYKSWAGITPSQYRLSRI